MSTTIRRNPIIRAVAVLALALGLFAIAPAASGAVEQCSAIPGDYASTMQLTANPSRTTPGSDVQITGTGYPTNCELTVYVDGNSIGTAVTDGNGTFHITWHVPSNARLGQHTVSTNVSNITETANVEVISSVTTTTPTQGTGGGNGGTGAGGSGILPKTGSDVLPFLAGGVTLLVLGSMLVLATRKRNTHRA